MVGMGLIMVAISWAGVVLIWRGLLESTRWFLWAAFLSFPTGFVAVLCGWYTAEVGRQPWVVYHILRTEDAITPSLTGGVALFSLIAYVAVYAVIYSFGLTYIYRLLRRGPAAEPDAVNQLPGRPIAAALQGSGQ
jgi:cytochrome bd ubiquinol oxidase subunit I